jgi:hypothetical protein
MDDRKKRGREVVIHWMTHTLLRKPPTAWNWPEFPIRANARRATSACGRETETHLRVIPAITQSTLDFRSVRRTLSRSLHPPTIP